MNLGQLTVELQAKTQQFTDEFKNAEKALKDFNRSNRVAEAAQKALDSSMVKTASTVEKTSKATKGLETSMKSAATAIRAVEIITTRTMDVLRGAFSLMEEAARTQSAKKYFEDSGKSIEAFRQATGGLVSDAEIFKKINLGDSLGLTADQMEKMSVIARAAAAKTGQSFDYMFDSIVKGEARASKPILDNLGILFSQAQAYRDFAEKIKAANEEMYSGIDIKTIADNLDEAGKKQAVWDATIKSTADAMEQFQRLGEGGAAQFDQFAAAWDNLKTAVGDALLKINEETGFVRALTSAMKDLRDVIDEISGMGAGGGVPASEVAGNVAAAAAKTVLRIDDRSADWVQRTVAGAVSGKEDVLELEAAVVQFQTTLNRMTEARLNPVDPSDVEEMRALTRTMEDLEKAGAAIAAQAPSAKIAAQLAGFKEMGKELATLQQRLIESEESFRSLATAAGAPLPTEPLSVIQEQLDSLKSTEAVFQFNQVTAAITRMKERIERDSRMGFDHSKVDADLEDLQQRFDNFYGTLGKPIEIIQIEKLEADKQTYLDAIDQILKAGDDPSKVLESITAIQRMIEETTVKIGIANRALGTFFDMEADVAKQGQGPLPGLGGAGFIPPKDKPPGGMDEEKLRKIREDQARKEADAREKARRDMERDFGQWTDMMADALNSLDDATDAEDKARRKAAEDLAKANEEFIKQLDELRKIQAENSEALFNLFQGIGDAFIQGGEAGAAKLADVVGGPIASAVGPALASGLDSAFSTLVSSTGLAAGAEAVGGTAATMPFFSPELMTMLIGLFIGLAATLEPVINIVQAVSDGLIGLVALAVGPLLAGLEPLGGAVQRLLMVIGRLIGAALEPFVPLIIELVSVIVFVLDMITGIVLVVSGILHGLGTLMQPAIEAMEFFSNAINSAADFLLGAFVGLFNLIIDFQNNFRDDDHKLARANLRDLRESLFSGGQPSSSADEPGAEATDANTDATDRNTKAVENLAREMRNLPSGYKINNALYQTTNPSARDGSEPYVYEQSGTQAGSGMGRGGGSGKSKGGWRDHFRGRL